MTCQSEESSEVIHPADATWICECSLAPSPRVLGDPCFQRTAVRRFAGARVAFCLAAAVRVVVAVCSCFLHVKNHPGLSFQYLLLSQPLSTTPTLDTANLCGNRLTFLKRHVISNGPPRISRAMKLEKTQIRKPIVWSPPLPSARIARHRTKSEVYLSDSVLLPLRSRGVPCRVPPARQYIFESSPQL